MAVAISLECVGLGLLAGASLQPICFSPVSSGYLATLQPVYTHTDVVFLVALHLCVQVQVFT